MTPAQVANALADLPIIKTLSTTLATQAATLAEAVRADLATPPGGPHDQPWRQTGSLQASITLTTDAFTAQIASGHPAAASQEFGTSAIPPCPFLAPAAASLAEPIAHTIGKTLADIIARRLT